MTPTSRKPLLTLRRLALAAALVPGLFLGYALYVEAAAVTKAAAFCLNTAVGSSVDNLGERALAAGAVDLNNQATWKRSAEQGIRWVRHPNGSQGLPVTFLGFDYSEGPTRHYCAITARNGVVLSTMVQHLD
jgi:hypothetical protein